MINATLMTDQRATGRTLIVMAVAVLLAACGSDSPAADAGADDDAGMTDAGVAAGECVSQEGTRIKFRGYHSPDGDFLPTGLHDTELDVPCTYQKTGEGWFCLPYTPTRYRSSDCSDPIAVVNGDLPTYHVHAADLCTGADFEVHKFGAEIFGFTTLYMKSGENCLEIEVGEGPDRYYELGTEMGLNVFVSAERALQGVGRIRAIRLDGDDSSRYCSALAAHPFFDTQLGQDCGEYYGADDVLRCTPAGGTIIAAATDATCSATINVSTGGCSEGTSTGYALQPIEDDTTCPQSYEYFEKGEELPPVYELFQPEVCDLREGSYYAVGAAVADSVFEPLSEEWVGDGRLQRKLVGAADDASLFSGGWRDTELDVPCYASYTQDKMYCMPPTLERRLVSRDPACETEVQIPFRDTQICGDADRRFVRTLEGIHELGPKITTPLYDAYTGSCQELNDTRYTYYEIGTPVENLVEFTVAMPL